MSRPGPRTVTGGGAIWSTGDGMTTDDETEAEAQMEAATEAIRETVLRLLQEGEIDPQYIVLAAAGADVARLGDVDLETVLGGLGRPGARGQAGTPREAGDGDDADGRERVIRP